MKRLLALFACFCIVVTSAPLSFAEIGTQGSFEVVGSIVGSSGYVDIEMVMPEESVKVCGIQLSYTLPSNFYLNGTPTTQLKTKTGKWNVKAQNGVLMLDNDLNENINVSNKLTNGAYVIARLPIAVKGSPDPANYPFKLTVQGITSPISAKPYFTDSSSYFSVNDNLTIGYYQSMATATVSGIVNKEYDNGKARTQSVTVKINGKIVSSDDYDISYKNNKQPGLATAVISGYGNYSGSISKTFVIYPEKVASVTKTAAVDGITLSWSKSTGADGYYIYRSLSQKSGFSLVKTLGSTAVSYKDTGLLSGTAYYYRVIPYKTISGKKYSSGIYNTFAAKTSGYTVPKVAGVKAKQSNTSVNVSWNAVDKANGYIVYRSTSKTSGYKAVKTVESGKITSFTDSSVAAGKVYYYKVTAYRTYKNANGKGEISDAASVTTKVSAPAKPTLKSVKSSGIGGAAITIGKVSCSGYKVYYSTKKSSGYKCGYTGTSTSPKIKNLTMGKTYYFKVRAYNKANGKTVYGSYSSVKSVKIKKFTAPKTVKLTSAKNTAKKTATVKWKKTSGASGYAVYYSTKKNSGYKLAYSGKSTSCKIKSLKKGKKYYVKVRAYVSSGGDKLYGKYSSVKSVKITK